MLKDLCRTKSPPPTDAGIRHLLVSSPQKIQHGLQNGNSCITVLNSLPCTRNVLKFIFKMSINIRGFIAELYDTHYLKVKNILYICYKKRITKTLLMILWRFFNYLNIYLYISIQVFNWPDIYNFQLISPEVLYVNEYKILLLQSHRILGPVKIE